MGKKLTYDDVLAEAVYSVLEILRIKHEKVIITKFKTSDVLTMDNKELGDMVDIITKDFGYMEMVNNKFIELRNQYLLEDNYDPSGETKNEKPKVNDDIPEDVKFGW